MTVVEDARSDDFSFVEEMMEKALSPFYGGDHRAHARRIFTTHISGGVDRIGFFSLRQKMLIARVAGKRAGMIHLVLKRQSTCKISPLIVDEEFRGKYGIGSLLLKTAIEFARVNGCRQIYCTVSAENKIALDFFLKKRFSIAGKSKNQYTDGIDEFMLYLNIDEVIGEDEFDLDHISVLLMEEKHRDQVEKILLEYLPDDFQGIDETWIAALFAGHDRRGSRDIDQKYKVIFTATDRNDRVLGVAGATPKKGEPIKLMPLVAVETPAFFALLSDVPDLLREYGRKVYVHLVPDSEQTRFLQRAFWRLDGMLPDAYQVDRITQQWSRQIEQDEIMRTMRLKKKYLDLMRSGDKTLEVRVGYNNIKKVRVGDQVAFLSRDDRLIKEIVRVGRYKSFAEMLKIEDYRKILPDMNLLEVKSMLAEIYPKNKEQLGIIVFEVS